MANKEKKIRVYLEHLISRDSLRYTRPELNTERDSNSPYEALTLRDLLDDTRAGRARLLRKPDFQRSTWAWDPEGCVSLLESVVNGQVIPSIIMWESPDNGYDYVLDGAHRISVVLAWLRNDWGDNLSFDPTRDDEQEQEILQAAREVSELVKLRIGTIKDYQDAEKMFDNLVDAGKAPKNELDAKTFKRGQFYQRLLKGKVSFHILSVTGDYKTAEESFLKINSGGSPLTEWEAKLIENRDTAFARATMSIANIGSEKHYWPVLIPDSIEKPLLEAKVQEIILNIQNIQTVLFKPPYKTPIRRLQQPVMGLLDMEKKPYYVAELLTIIEGKRGQAVETAQLLASGKTDSIPELIKNGSDIISNVTNVFDHLFGDTPKSLALVPALYFYTEAGRYVRSLLYGFVYWLFANSDDNAILTKKRLFTAYRATFEKILRDNKEDIVSGITRKTGSGAEVTIPTAQYYHGLLELLISYKGGIQAKGFDTAYRNLTKPLTDKKLQTSQANGGKSRTATNRTKSILVLTGLLDSSLHCQICGGILDPTGPTQDDHIFPFALGGATTVSNLRLTHPFCNNDRDTITAIQNGQNLKLPIFVDPQTSTQYQQLSFFGENSFV